MSQYLDSARQGITVPNREELQAGLNNTLSSAQQSIGDLKNNVNSTLSEFSSTNAMNASSEFLNSNSIIAKFAFLILVLIAFIGLLKIGMMLISYILSPTKQPYLVKGKLQGNVPVTIRQDPADATSAVVYRSNNRDGGIEFTWCVWLYLNSLDDSNPYKHSHIFNKGNNTYSDLPDLTRGIATVNNSPGVYLNTTPDGKATNEILIKMDVLMIVQGSPQQPTELVISNIPLNTWFHLAIRLQNYNLTCYVNGTASKSVDFGKNVPKQNYEDVHINQNGGFNGQLSNLRYYDYALSASDIDSIVKYGPNLTTSSLESVPNNTYDYLSTGWYSSFK